MVEHRWQALKRERKKRQQIPDDKFVLNSKIVHHDINFDGIWNVNKLH